jgi:hypothetical protein
MLMILVLLLGWGLGWIVHRANVQREAVDALSRENAWFRYDWQGLDVETNVPPPRDLMGLRAVLGPHYFDTAIMVVAPKDNLDDRLMAQVGKLGHLKMLSISTSAGLSPAGAAEIRKLKDLERFYVNRGTPREFLPHLETMKWVRDFGWGSPDATEADMAAISRLSQLERLSIDGAPLTEAGLMHLTKLKNLRVLNVDGPTPKLDWEARLRFTRAMPNLRSFNLDGRPIVNKK